MGTAHYAWQDTGAVLPEFARDLRRARKGYRAFVTAGLAAGRRLELMGGSLVRSAGGWAAVRELRRGREDYAADERILGSTEFVATMLRELEREEAHRARARQKSLDLPSLIRMVAQNGGVTPGALTGGGRRPEVSRARDGLAYLWVEVLGRSGRQLAEELRVRPESVYKGARRGRRDLARWERILRGA